RSAVLVAPLAQVLAGRVEELGWKRPRADPRRVGLDDDDRALEGLRRDLQSRGDSGGGAGRGRYERIGPGREIEHCAVGALGQKRASAGEGISMVAWRVRCVRGG